MPRAEDKQMEDLHAMREWAARHGFVAIPLTQVEAMLREAISWSDQHTDEEMEEWIKNKIKEARQ